MATIDRFFMGRKLEPNLQIMRLLARIGERGAPTAATDLLGAPTTTVEAWCHTQAATVDASHSTRRLSA